MLKKYNFLDIKIFNFKFSVSNNLLEVHAMKMSHIYKSDRFKI